MCNYSEQDFDFVYSLLSDPLVMRYIGDGSIRDKKGAEDFLHWNFQMYQLGTDYGLKKLIRQTDQQPIGHAGLIPQMIDAKEELELGYWIVRDQWGKGYATEAAQSLKSYAVQELDRRRLIALIHQANHASASVARKLGMRFDKVITLDGQSVHVYATVVSHD